jgi:hypothetical protein
MKQSCRKCEQIAAAIEEWSLKQAHDRCWYYPDVFNRIANVLNLSTLAQPNLPPRAEFEEGCRRYQAEEYTENQSLVDESQLQRNLNLTIEQRLSEHQNSLDLLFDLKAAGLRLRAKSE